MEYDEIMDALNIIDDQAENGSQNLEEQEERRDAYEKVADFISKHAKRK